MERYRYQCPKEGLSLSELMFFLFKVLEETERALDQTASSFPFWFLLLNSMCGHPMFKYGHESLIAKGERKTNRGTQFWKFYQNLIISFLSLVF